MNYLSFDIGGTNTKYSLINYFGEILESGSVPTKDKKEEIFQEIKSLVENYKEKNVELTGLAFSMPGVIDIERGHMITGGALFDLYDFPFKKELEKFIGLPVELENDVNCVALAEKWIGNAKESKNFLCMTIGTGVGGAVFINGEMVRGENFSAGEFGFMITDRRENYEEASLSMSGSVRGGLIQSYAKLKGVDWEKLDGKKIFELAELGDKIAEKVIEDFYNSISYSVYNLSVALNSEKILIGGEITTRKDFIEKIEKKVMEIKEKTCPLKFPKIERCKFLNDSGKIGAVYHFIKQQEKREK
ncbi:ROK family protein [Fusobacterium sp.]|uniref:ROK family protein n=1 Tax=Fusobacterium sp. TaxID=68766 RepID=UPI002609A955|nr:ROK family protein [Fusobacterium sp.]